jgi:hypothetical protein
MLGEVNVKSGSFTHPGLARCPVLSLPGTRRIPGPERGAVDGCDLAKAARSRLRPWAVGEHGPLLVSFLLRLGCFRHGTSKDKVICFFGGGLKRKRPQRVVCRGAF